MIRKGALSCIKKQGLYRANSKHPQVPLEWPRFHTGNGISRKEQDVAIPSRTKFERVYAGRNEKRPPIFPGTKVGDYNRVGTILRCEKSNQGANKDKRWKYIRIVRRSYHLRENICPKCLRRARGSEDLKELGRDNLLGFLQKGRGAK